MKPSPGRGRPFYEVQQPLARPDGLRMWANCPSAASVRRPRLLPFLAAIVALGASAYLAQPATQPLELVRGSYLLLDEALLSAQYGVIRRVVSPERSLAGPVVPSAGPYYAWQPWVTVLYEPGRKEPFRMWYNAFDPSVFTDNAKSVTRLAYMESRDGLSWPQRPQILKTSGALTFGARVLDRGDRFMPRTERYVLAYFVLDSHHRQSSGIYLDVSPDGIHWSSRQRNPIVSSETNDIVNLFWDDLGSRYTLMMKDYREYSWVDRHGRPYRQTIRLVSISHSRDLLGWTKPATLFAPDSDDAGLLDFYGTAGVARRGDLLVGFLKVSRDDVFAAGAEAKDEFGIGYTVLTWSRDGMIWHRDREDDGIFLAPNPDPAAWDHSHAWIDSAVRVDDEVYLYCGGYRRGHKANRFRDRQIGVVRMKVDRYVAREAAVDGARLQTRLIRWKGARLSANVDPNGDAIYVRVLDPGGRPLRGFDWSDCEPLRTDGVRVPIRCRRPLEAVAGNAVMLDFSFTKGARLFALNLD